ncbi:ALI_collapsed_G0025310.mRNA.1.CDS.1 [Saccharomyces cerevisiae]|nr:ALI_collapsed_G0025310.mRNA.1.CDS.1 [Saccharomyces cerevisiae]
MKERIGRVVIAADVNWSPVTIEDMGCTGALTALLRVAIKPNLMQTLEGTLSWSMPAHLPTSLSVPLLLLLIAGFRIGWYRAQRGKTNWLCGY